MKIRRKFITAAALLATAAPLLFTLPMAQAEGDKVELLYVQTAHSVKVDTKVRTFRLVGVGKQTVYFSDRPVRIAGHVSMADYLVEWSAAAGPNNFSKVPPNATLSVYEPKKSENTLIVVEISQPVLDGNDLIYSYKLLDGAMPATGGATALFIDTIGVGGGVGVGRRGAGAGRRGVGVR